MTSIHTESFADGATDGGRWGLRDRMIREAASDRTQPTPLIEPQADEWTLTMLSSLRDARRAHQRINH